jgi:hypothetical protein
MHVCCTFALLATVMLSCGNPTLTPAGGPATAAGRSPDASEVGTSPEGEVPRFNLPEAGTGPASPAPGGGVDGTSCATEKHRAERTPVDVALLVDVSGSMAGQWGMTIKIRGMQDALASFLNDPRSAGLRVAITFFPTDATNSCQPEDYETPAVSFADLPGAAARLISVVNAQAPRGGTPTAGAVPGVLTFIRRNQATIPGRRSVLVLATDGLPGGCAPDPVGFVAGQLQAARTGPNPIATYVIGILDSPGGPLAPGRWNPAASGSGAVNLWAAAGGTMKAFVPDPLMPITSQLVDALNQIRGQLDLPCEFAIPKPTMADRGIDLGKVNVRFTTAASGVQELAYVASKDRCDARGGWYYDIDPGAGTPTRIIVCSATCDRFKAGEEPAVELVYGCQTRVID